ncbi:MAG: hypothetical protein WBG92_14370 [Thiohalocapsa sp.]
MTYYFVVRSHLPPYRYSSNSNEVVFHSSADAGSTNHQVHSSLLPLFPEEFFYEAELEPFIADSLIDCKPLAVDSSSDGQIELSLGLPSFEAPVDVYVAVYAPELNQYVHFLSADRGWVSATSGWVKWAGSSFGNFETSLLRYRNLPGGIYSFSVAVAPEGRTDAFYLWRTDVIF